MPKRIDCKAKTADLDVLIPSTGRMARVAGLVVDPTLPAMARAHHDPERAKIAWNNFMRDLGNIGLVPKGLYRPYSKTRGVLPNGGFYTAQIDPYCPRYGSVMFNPFRAAEIHEFKLSKLYLAHACYIHGDYDLYGIIPALERERRDVISGELLGQPNLTSGLTAPIADYINRRIGSPMIQHGSQEHLGHVDEPLDVFWPTGEISYLPGWSAVTRLYRKDLGGRGAGAPKD